MHPQYAVSSKYIRSSTMTCYEIFAYGRLSQSFLHQSPHDAVKPESLMGLSIIINGKSYKPLKYYLYRALKVLNLEIGEGLSSLPVAFGLGDGHGGKFIDRASLSMLYVGLGASMVGLRGPPPYKRIHQLPLTLEMHSKQAELALVKR